MRIVEIRGTESQGYRILIGFEMAAPKRYASCELEPHSRFCRNMSEYDDHFTETASKESRFVDKGAPTRSPNPKARESQERKLAVILMGCMRAISRQRSRSI
ncbi:hypothetical protein CV102_18210 [Natronococcus pandeyae]|uniref:Uncharacterized protein n=1 Tax=Natronococcus pandeyae TaxID=2055836 RepID=A0A8J8Q0L9_9EURY|nr:hypothetical protein CV102_18210 [Natronococcus pandeyae]